MVDIEINTMHIFLLCALVACCMYAVYEYFKPQIEEKLVMSIINNLTEGNFVILSGDQLIHQNISDPSKPVPKLIINPDRKSKFITSVYERYELGLGETYMAGDWKSDNLELLLTNMCLSMDKLSDSMMYVNAGGYGSSAQVEQDKKNITYHYDVGNDFYQLFLTDPLMAYSCGIWNTDTKTLTDAQYNKVNLIINKMRPSAGQKILDIGCGWGKIAKYVANKTSTHVTGITISDKQGQQIRDMLALNAESEQVNNNVDVMVMDYRNLDDKYHHIYSIGMFEHVRYENYDIFFQMIKRCLMPGGRMVLHTIVKFDKNPSDVNEVMESFIIKYIFPGGQIPAPEWIVNAIQRSGLRIIHAELFGGQHYAKTLREWRRSMLKNRKYILEHYDETLLRRYDYYFASCIAAFSTGSLGIGHYVITNQQVLDTSNNYICIKS